MYWEGITKKTPFILSMAKNGGEGGGAAQIVSDTFLTVIFPKKSLYISHELLGPISPSETS